MRHGKPPPPRLPYAISSVLGLAAPALVAMFLTSSVRADVLAEPAAPERAAMTALSAFSADPAPLHAPVFGPPAVTSPAPTAVTALRKVARAQPSAVATQSNARRVAARDTGSRTRRVVAATPSAAPNSSGSSSSAQPRGVDDYRWKDSNDYYALDSWDFTQRQCVSFAAWRLAQHGRSLGSHAGGTWGSAFNWDDTARAKGYPVTRTPRVGAIAHWNAGERSSYYSKGSSRADGSYAAGSYGHVGYVSKVYSDGSVLVEQYNGYNNRSYGVMRVKAPRYLLIG